MPTAPAASIWCASGSWVVRPATGGLKRWIWRAFWGSAELGWRRAHELVDKLPGEMVDAWAYHGHGPGAQAERNAWNRQDKAVRDAGKAGRDYIATESGLYANDPATWRRQAQTIVEKVVFAQSKGAPTFFWFNIHISGSDGGYTTVERNHEPRPAVLAHRTMVKCLKGLRHAGELDLSAPQAEAHYFAAADRRRALVLWSDRGEITRTMSIGAGCSKLRLVDLYGNVSRAVEAAPGLVQVGIDADPVFLTWDTGDRDHRVVVPPPPVALPEKLSVVPGRVARLPVTVRNPTDAALSTSVRFVTVGKAPVRVTSGEQKLTVGPRGEKATTVDVAVLVRDDTGQKGDACRIRLATGVELKTIRTIAVSSRRDEAAKQTLYEAVVERGRIGDDRFAIQVRVEDDDWGELKQHAGWGEGDDPERWFQAWMRR